MRSPVVVPSTYYLKLIERFRHIGAWALQPSTGAMTWSEGFRRLTRVEAPAGIDTFMAVVHPEDRWIVGDVLGGAPGVSVERRYRVVWPDGAIRWHACFTDTLPDAREGSAVLVAVVEDVTESQFYEDRLMRQHRAYDGLVELSGGVSWRANSLGVVHSSRSWSEFTGQSQEALQAGGWLSAVHPEDLQGAAKTGLPDLENATASDLNVRVRRHDGVYVKLDLKVSPVPGPQGQACDWVAYASLPAATQPVKVADTTLTAAQMRGCRGLLGWTVGDLAAASGVSAATIARYEARSLDEDAPRPRTLAKLRNALQDAGIEFIADEAGGAALRLKSC